MKDIKIEKEWCLELLDLLENHMYKATHDGEKVLMLEIIQTVEKTIEVKEG